MLALCVLFCLTSTFQTRLLALFLACVSGQKTSFFERRTHIFIGLTQRTRNSVSHSSSLTRVSCDPARDQRTRPSAGHSLQARHLLDRAVREPLPVFAVRLSQYTQPSFFIPYNSNSFGFCAECGCSLPEYTRNFFICARPNFVLGIIPLTASKIIRSGKAASCSRIVRLFRPPG